MQICQTNKNCIIVIMWSFPLKHSVSQWKYHLHVCWITQRASQIVSSHVRQENNDSGKYKDKFMCNLTRWLAIYVTLGTLLRCSEASFFFFVKWVLIEKPTSWSIMKMKWDSRHSVSDDSCLGVLICSSGDERVD